MRKFTCCVLFLCFGFFVAGAPAEYAQKQRDPPLAPIFSDDFSRDTRQQYEIKGEAQWTKNLLTLKPGASLSRKLDAGAWVEADLRLQFPEKEDCQVTLRFGMEGVTDFLLVWIRKTEPGKSLAQLLVFDTNPKAKPGKQFILKMRQPLANLTSGLWRVSYRYGAIRITLPQKQKRFYAYIANSAATVSKVLCQSVGHSLSLASFDVRGAKMPAPLTAEEKKTAAEANALNRQVVALHQRGKFGAAVQVAQQALAIRQRVLGEEHPHYANSLHNLAEMYRSMGEHAKAEPLFLQARDLRKRVVGEQHPHYAASLHNLAALYQSMGEYAKAERLNLQARDIYKRVRGEQHPHYANSLHNLAELYKSMGEYAKAERLNLRVRDIYKRVLGEQHPHYALSLCNLGLLYHSMGEHAKAERLYLQARDIMKRAQGEQHPHYALNLNNLAGLYHSMGEYAKAEPLYLQARDLRKRVVGEQHLHYAQSLHNLASLYESMGEYAKAERVMLQARSIIKRVVGQQHLHYAQSLHNLAELYRSMGEYAEAEPLFLQTRSTMKRVLGEQHPHYALSLNNLAILYKLMGEYAKAEPLVTEAILVLRSAAFKAIPALSDAQARSWLRRNRPRADVTLSIYRRVKSIPHARAYQVVWNTKALATRLKAAAVLPPDASPEAKRAFANLRDARLKLARLVSATPKPGQAKRFQQTLSATTERKEKLEKEFATLSALGKRELVIRDAKIDKLLARIPAGIAVVDFVRLGDMRAEEKEITFRLANGAISKRRVNRLQSFPVYDAFVLRGARSQKEDQIAWVPLGDAAPIDKAIAAWRSRLTGGDRGLGIQTVRVDLAKKQRPARQILREKIWDQLAPHLEGCHTVILLPDGALHRLPWAALPGRKKDTHLIEDYALATASYGQQLFGLLSDEPPQGDRLFAAGGIDYDNRRPAAMPGPDQPALLTGARRSPARRADKEKGKWPFLTGAKQETDAIRRLWAKPASIASLSGAEVNEQTVCQALTRARYAHLATHGFFAAPDVKNIFDIDLREQKLFQSDLGPTISRQTAAGRSPLLLTGLVLSGANLPPVKNGLGLPTGEDGILTAEEIVGLNLRNTELITLSACETGLGDVAAGEGVFGLQRALHQAGARTVVASLWKVSDNATRALMTEFYKNLWEKKMPKLQALREAQLTMLERYDLKTGTLRGLGKKSVKVSGANDSPEGATQRLPPSYWAGFQLSGDWR